MTNKAFVKSIMAGFTIGLGGLIYLSLDNKVIGSALFSVGLFVVLTFGFNLFTGKVCYTIDKGGPSIPDMISIWVGNFIGTLILALMIRGTRVGAAVAEKATALCDVKNGDSYLSLFLLGILCNIFIFIAVDEFKNNSHELGKYLGIFLGVMGFILAGTEHCVADMFYYNMAFNYSVNAIIKLLVITAGNTVGGICINYVCKKIK